MRASEANSKLLQEIKRVLNVQRGDEILPAIEHLWATRHKMDKLTKFLAEEGIQCDPTHGIK